VQDGGTEAGQEPVEQNLERGVPGRVDRGEATAVGRRGELAGGRVGRCYRDQTGADGGEEEVAAAAGRGGGEPGRAAAAATRGGAKPSALIPC
jgi:hypothetical protein